MHEPTFRRSARRAATREYILPGNKDYRGQGDDHRAPPSAASSGAATSAAIDGDGDDEFRFVLSREEFLDLFLEDLELPELAKKQARPAREAQ